MLLQKARLVECHGGVQGCLATHGGQNRVWLFLEDDALDEFRGDRLDIGGIGQTRIGHDRCRVRVDEDDAIAFLFQCLAGLRAGIVEFTGLTNHDGASANDKDRRNICTFRHGSGCLLVHEGDKALEEIE